MNKIWTIMMLLSIAILTFVNPGAMLPSMLTAGADAVKLSINLAGIYLLWLGVMNLMEGLGLNKVIGRALKPVIRLLFGKQSDETSALISLNMSANILGLGNAATPMGMKAMQAMEDGTDTATDAMIMLLVVNATSIQLLPTTVLGIRAGFMSISPGDIIVPTLLATLVTTVTGILLCKLCAHFSRKRRAKKQTSAFAVHAEAAKTRLKAKASVREGA